MEELLAILKEFIVEHGEYFTGLASKDVPMYALPESAVVLHPVDLGRYEQNQICVLLPETEDDDEELSTNAYLRTATQFTVAFINRGYDAETLIKQSCRYSEGFKRMLMDNPTLGDQIIDYRMGQRTFYPDAGTVEDQLSAVEINLTLYTEEEY